MTEQDHLIHTLAAQNASQNESLARILLALPLLSTIAYIRPLFNPTTTSFALFCITSLLATAFLLHRLPPTETGIDILDAWASGGKIRAGGGAASTSATTTTRLRLRNPLGGGGGGRGNGAAGLGVLGRGLIDTRSPLEKTLPYLNLGLAILLIFMGLVRGDERGGGFGWVSMGNVPGLVYSVAITAKMVMAGVDPERDLAGLKYGYKGA